MLITQRDFIKLRDVIYRRSGIFIDEKKYGTLSRKIEDYIQKNGYETFRAFFHEIRFNQDKTIFQDLINIVTVNETYFYREKYQFETLVDHVLPMLHQKKPDNQPIRILCSPSSTGEEPYSIALHLLDEGKLVEERDFEIIGIDIDSTVIQKAKMGKFTKRSIQFIPPHLLSNYFNQDGMLYQIADFLTDVIDFQVVNVMDKIQMKKLGKFDVIFSRNMLIYFDDTSRREVAMTFYEMLNPNGYVFLGHAESMSRIVSIYESQKLGESIVYQKTK
ncbi:MAG: chemotaxis protein CheR [Campylobacteraceae bacterium 4484_4]|nr:MAG: chemotaxis protein CheR [Campylobacteraceae bacterium 4484_4]